VTLHAVYDGDRFSANVFDGSSTCPGKPLLVIFPDPVPSHSPVVLSQLDVVLLILLTFFSFWTHHFMIHRPDKPIFDEAHFGGFTNRHIHGSYFFDIHPPLSQLLIFGLAELSQYPSELNFSDPCRHRTLDSISLRQIAAPFATFCGPLLLVAMRCFGLGTLALMVACDNAMIVEGRFILTDGILHCFVCLAVMATAIVRTQEPRGLGW
jgi:dolichyl-phosphate-mannose-protein mannosyltransferase